VSARKVEALTDAELRLEVLERLELFAREDGLDTSKLVPLVQVICGVSLLETARRLRERIPGKTATAVARALFEADVDVRAFVQSRVDLGDPTLADAPTKRAGAWSTAMQVAWDRDELGARTRYMQLARAAMPGIERGLK
jgi:hypothetical protein